MRQEGHLNSVLFFPQTQNPNLNHNTRFRVGRKSTGKLGNTLQGNQDPEKQGKAKIITEQGDRYDMTTKSGGRPHQILRQKNNINGKAGEIQIKSRVHFIVVDQCWFFSFDKYTRVM